jgi:D-3-phosphoglycerate dehydrogenase
VLRAGTWRDHTGLGTLLAGQTIGIVGLGRIGGGVASRLAGFEVRVLATDPYIDPARATALGAELVPLDRLLEESSVVTVHVPLTGETHNLIDAPQLARMRREAYLVNTSRGAVVNEAALVAAIERDALAGAAIDVFADEPLPAGSPLRRLDPERVILTPHSVGANLAMRTTGMRMAMAAIEAAMAGELPGHLLNPAAVPVWTGRFADQDPRNGA